MKQMLQQKKLSDSENNEITEAKQRQHKFLLTEYESKTKTLKE